MTYAGGQWQQACLFGITRAGGSEVQFAAKTRELTMEGGKRPISIETLINGGNLVNLEPGEMFVVKAKIAIAEIDEVCKIFAGDVTGAVQELTTVNVLNMYELRAAILWHNGTTASTASGATGASDKGFRIYADDGYMTECTPDYSSNRLAMDVTIEFPPFTAAAVGNLHRESSDGTAAIAALGAYS